MNEDIPRKHPSKARARKAMKAFRVSLRPAPPPAARAEKGVRPPYRALYVVRSEQIVKLGITGNLEVRLRQHRRQGLHKVVYILHSSDADGIVELEKSWRAFVRANPGVRVTREELPDGYTEALPLSDCVRQFIDRLLRGS